MSYFEIEPSVPTNPLEVCIPFAHRLSKNPDFDRFDNDKVETSAVTDMNFALHAFELIKNYRVITSLAFVLPKKQIHREETNISIVRMDLETSFEGSLVGARTLKIGRWASGGSVRATCLTFDDAHIRYRVAIGPAGKEGVVPYDQSIAKDEQLYVPVFAVNQIHKPI